MNRSTPRSPTGPRRGLGARPLARTGRVRRRQRRRLRRRLGRRPGRDHHRDVQRVRLRGPDRRSGTPPTPTSRSSRRRSAPGTTPRRTSTPSSPPAPGLSDIEAIEGDAMPAILAESDAFVDLTDPELDGRWLDFKAAAAHQRRRPDDRLRHRRRPGGHLLPRRPVREGRPADRPRRGRGADGHLGRLLRHRRGVRREGARTPRGTTPSGGTAQAMLNQVENPFEQTDNTIDVENPELEAVYATMTGNVEKGLSTTAHPVERRLDRLLPERRLRHDGLPRLDARRGLRQRRGRRGLGLRRRLPRRRRQLGRLVPDRARRSPSTPTRPRSSRPGSPRPSSRSRPSRPSAPSRARSTRSTTRRSSDMTNEFFNDAPVGADPRRTARPRSRCSRTRARSTPTSSRPSRPRCSGWTTARNTPERVLGDVPRPTSSAAVLTAGHRTAPCLRTSTCRRGRRHRGVPGRPPAPEPPAPRPPRDRRALDLAAAAPAAGTCGSRRTSTSRRSSSCSWSSGMFPLVYTAYVSVYDWSLLGGKGEFVGLQNYRDVLDNPYFLKSAVNTISIFLLSSVPQIVIALVLAGLLDTALRGRDAVADGRAAAVRGRAGRRRDHLRQPVRRPLRPDQRGARLDRDLGRSQWHTDRLASHVAIATMVNWRWTGYNALIFLAAMQAVPRDLYESAALDGAGRVRQFTSITVPMIRPTDDLRDHHLDHRRAADLRRAAALRQPRWRRTAAATASSAP